MNAERGIRYDLDDIFLSRRIGMDRENIEAYRKEARKRMEGGREGSEERGTRGPEAGINDGRGSTALVRLVTAALG